MMPHQHVFFQGVQNNPKKSETNRSALETPILVQLMWHHTTGCFLGKGTLFIQLWVVSLTRTNLKSQILVQSCQKYWILNQ